MICPHCNTGVDSAIIISETAQVAWLEGNKVVGYGASDGGGTTAIECPHCHMDIIDLVDHSD